MTIKINNLTKIYNDRKVLDDISFEVKDGEVLAVIGFSGSGKSTILKLISGLITSDGGDIKVEDGDIAMVFQYSALFDSLNVFDNISFALHERKEFRKKYTPSQIKSMVAKCLEIVGLPGIEDKFPHELSGGMQKRVSLARAIITNPKYILYDEPTAGLDPIASTVIENYIIRLSKDINATSVLVTHQMSTIRRCANRVIMLYNGKIVFDGTPDDLIKQDTPYTRQFVTGAIDGPMKITATSF